MGHPFPDFTKFHCFALVSSCWSNSHTTVLKTERFHKGSKYAPCPMLTLSGVRREGGQENSIAIHIQAIWRCSQGQKLNTREPPAAWPLLLGHVAPAQADTTATCSHSNRHRAQTETVKDLNSILEMAWIPITSQGTECREELGFLHCTWAFEKCYLRTSPLTGPHRLESHFFPLSQRNTSGALSLCTATAIPAGANGALGFAVLGYTASRNYFLAPFPPPF